MNDEVVRALENLIAHVTSNPNIMDDAAVLIAVDEARKAIAKAKEAES